MKILMVCLGNICRSPLAEALLKEKLPSGFLVESRGTSSLHEGQGADKRMIETAREREVDLTGHRAKGLSKSDITEFDFIFCMDESNLRNTLSLTKSKEEQSKIKLLREDGENVPDPYFGGKKGFIEVFELLNQELDQTAQFLLDLK